MLAAGRVSTTRREGRRGARRAEVADGFEGSCWPRRVLRSAIILSSVRISRSVSPSKMQSPPSGECYPRKHQTRAELSIARLQGQPPYPRAILHGDRASPAVVLVLSRRWSSRFSAFPASRNFLLDYPLHCPLRPVEPRSEWFGWIYVNN